MADQAEKEAGPVTSRHDSARRPSPAAAGPSRGLVGRAKRFRPYLAVRDARRA
jgi:hypothetical protein